VYWSAIRGALRGLSDEMRLFVSFKRNVHVGLDTTSSETDDDDGGNIAAESSTVLNGNRQGCRPQNHEALRIVLDQLLRARKDQLSLTTQ
jgi:hypothetical protein